MARLLPGVDIRALLERHAGIRVVSRAYVRGVVEYHSNCPWCGGTDRFVTRPETGGYTCKIRASGCGRSGDALDFLQQYKQMSFAQACKELGFDESELCKLVGITGQEQEPTVSRNRSFAPARTWQDAGHTLIDWAQRALYASSRGREMLAYLHSRGLTDDTIHLHRLGYVPRRKDGSWYETSLTSWGIDPETVSPEMRKRGTLRIPDGILIPWLGSDALWKLAIKRPGEKVSYGQVLGSGEGLFNYELLCRGEPAMIVEGEFCAMSVRQEAGDLVNCVATGSNSRGRREQWIERLAGSSFVLQSYDADEPGDAGARFWLNTHHNCMRWSTMQWKDPNDLLQSQPNGICTLREWVWYGLQAGMTESAQYLTEDVVKALIELQMRENIQAVS